MCVSAPTVPGSSASWLLARERSFTFFRLENSAAGTAARRLWLSRRTVSEAQTEPRAGLQRNGFPSKTQQRCCRITTKSSGEAGAGRSQYAPVHCLARQAAAAEDEALEVPKTGDFGRDPATGDDAGNGRR